MMGEKRCSTCHQARPLTDFNRRAAAPDGLQSRCRACSRDWYLANLDQHKATVRARNSRVRGEHADRLVDYLLEHPCVDCGEDDLRVLEFDHEDPEGKSADVTRLVACSLPWRRVEAEIAKCSVRCANCHRRRTAEMFGFARQGAEQRRQDQQHDAALRRLLGVVGPPRPPA